MRKNWRKHLALLLAVVMTFCGINIFQDAHLTAYADTAGTATELQPQASDNRNGQNYTKFGSPVYSYLVPLDTGYMRVEYIYNSEYVLKDGKTGENTDDYELVVTKMLLAEYYDDNFELLSKKTIDMDSELSDFAGFYAGSDAYYVAYKQELKEFDEEGNDIFDLDKEYIRVVKYDKNWNRLAATHFTNNNSGEGEVTDIAKPLQAGSLRMEEYNGHLYVHTCYQEKGTYSGGYSQGHQMSMILDILESDMTMNLPATRTDVLYSWVSHSFNQFLLIDDGALVTLNHGDAGDARGAHLGKYKLVGTNTELPEKYGELNVMTWNGSSGENYTGASLGGLERSETSYLTAGNTVVQDADFASYKRRNIYVTATSREAVSSEHTMKYMLTDYEESGEISASTPHLVKLNDNRFLVLWSRLTDNSTSLYEEYHPGSLSYVLVDGNGVPVSRTFTQEGEVTGCKPIVKNHKAIWYACSDTGMKFYSIDEEGNYEVHSVNGLETPELVAVSGTAEGTCIQWKAVEGAAGYEIIRIDETDGDETMISAQRYTVEDGSLSYTDQNAYFDGRVYNYLVYAFNDTVRSYGTAWHKVEVFRGPYPKVSNTAGGVSISWNQIENASGYKIYRYVSGESVPEKQIDIAAGDITQYVDAEVNSGVKYKYEIIACRGAVASAPSTAAAILYLSAPEVTIQYNYVNLDISWSAVPGATAYYLTKWNMDTNEKLSTVRCSATGELTCFDVGFTEGVTYKYTVYAFSDENGGTSGAEGEKTITYKKPTASASPSPSVSPSATPSASVVPSVSPSPSVAPSVSPSASPSPSVAPSVSPSASAIASTKPSTAPSTSPSIKPSAAPSASASVSPSASTKPSAAPSARPSTAPSASPTQSASAKPGASPSVAPSANPSAGTGSSTAPSESASPLPLQVPEIVTNDYIWESTRIIWGAVAGADGYLVTWYDINSPAVSTQNMVEGNENTVFLHENGIGGVTYGYEIQAYRFENGRMILGEKSQAIQIVYKKSEIPPASMEPQVSEEPKNSEGPYVPPAPVITSISVVDNGVKIEWDEVKDAAGYVLKCFQEGVGTAIFNVRREGNGNVSYIYEKLIENVKYTFYICAYTDGPEGTYGRYSDGTEYVYRKNDDTSSSEPPAVSESPSPGPAPSQEPQSSQEPDAMTLKGDANGDNHLDLADAQLTLKAALKIIPLTDINVNNADVDGQAGITLADAQMILKAALKIIQL